jgi:tRNA(Ile)-lysidine synthase
MEPLPIPSDEFAALMAGLGPFEAPPRLAVALSGGADSLALALLADDWARALGGAVVALTVDHRLRPGSADEAARVAVWMAELGIAHVVLVRDGPPLTADLQAQARQARHALLGEYCAAHGILHLLLAHHREDQAETLLLRLGRGSGVEGLAAMAPIRPTRWGRLLRPLLDIPAARLRATLTDRGRDWIEDPSNRNPAFARVRMRSLLPRLSAEGLSPDRLAATARHMARAREAIDAEIARSAVRWVRLDPACYARLDPAALSEAPDEIALRLLARLLMLIGGGAHPPRLERLERLRRALLAAPVARTLGGCRLIPAGGDWLVVREPGAMAGPVPVTPGEATLWDNRVLIRLESAGPGDLRLGGLGAEGWRTVRAAIVSPPPAGTRVQIPALFDQRGVCAVPSLGYNRKGTHAASLLLEPLAGVGPGLAGAPSCCQAFRHYIHDTVSGDEAWAD